MKIAIVNSLGNNKSTWDHTTGNELNSLHNCEGVFLDDALINDGSIDLPVINSCIGVQNLMLNPEVRKGVLESIGIYETPIPVRGVVLYGLFNGKIFSDLVEISYSGRFMTGDVGSNVGFSHGVGIKCGSEIYSAFPSLIKLRELLGKLEYRGEVTCNISSDYTITNLTIGHNQWGFGIFSEIAQVDTQDLLHFMFGKLESCMLYESICVANLVSKPPFPSGGLGDSLIHAPKGAEKHLWRFVNKGCGALYIICHGEYLKEARKRIRRTIENLLVYDQELQYRIDYGMRMEFVFNREKYKKFEEMTFKPSPQSPITESTSAECTP